jgi:carbonic anhydrase
MPESFVKILQGYKSFVQKYADGDSSIMEALSKEGQSPKTMVVACCDSRVDPALIFQCEPGDLFVVRNVANIVPPYEKDEAHHGTSAALEFGIKFLKVENLILLGHSQCGGIQALQNHDNPDAVNNDFINNWVSVVHSKHIFIEDHDDYAKFALQQSYNNCLTFPWIKERLAAKTLEIHLWFFDIKSGQIFEYSEEKDGYEPVA